MQIRQTIVEPVARVLRPAGGIEWRGDVDPASWDAVLADLGGHPLQSALWGNARREVDGVRDHRWMVLHEGKPIWMIRIEQRRLPLAGWIGWAPRGPTGSTTLEPGLIDAVTQRLRGERMRLLVTDPWREVNETTAMQAHRPRTIWIDLGQGEGSVWRAFDSRFRQGVRRSEKAGVSVEVSSTHSDIEAFFDVCIGISLAKGFRLPASLALMKSILADEHRGSVEARLFVGRFQRKIGAGALILKCGQSIHFFWGGTARDLSKERVGEAVHWAAMRWAMAENCRLYDQEGIDPAVNPSTYAFKKKMGGREVILVGKQYFQASLLGRQFAWLAARRQ